MIALLMIVSLVMGQRAAPAEPTVVFVCEHGAAKSVIATAYFNKIAAERGLHARAVYRGVNPQDALSVSALKGLRDDGLTLDLGRRHRLVEGDDDLIPAIHLAGLVVEQVAASGAPGTGRVGVVAQGDRDREEAQLDRCCRRSRQSFPTTSRRRRA